MVTRAEMLAIAEAEGFGSKRQLASKFVNWQRRGLIGHAIGKVSRRGGEGLWHSRQNQLWLAWLAQERAGAWPKTLASAVVGLWLLEADGVEVTQAQRALGYWFPGPQGTGRRSTARSLTQRDLEGIAHPKATRKAKRALRDLIEEQNAVRRLIASDESAAVYVLEVIDPEGEQTEGQRWYAGGYARSMRLRLQAVERFELLLRSTDEVHALWQWARRLYATSTPAYEQNRDGLAAWTGLPGAFSEPVASETIKYGAQRALLLLGCGLGEDIPDAIAAQLGPPPRIGEARP